MAFDFQKQLKLGQEAEEKFLKLYQGGTLLTFEGRAWDYVRVEDGLRVELKSDLSDYTNFFIERWSMWESLKEGGPWQALDKGADIFIYWFVNRGVYYEFTDIPMLILAVESLHSSPKFVKNRTYSGMGYAVPEVLLGPCGVRVEVAEEKKGRKK